MHTYIHTYIHTVRFVSFLPGMRYYAGNWPISVWLIKRSAYHKLRDNVKTYSGSDGVEGCSRSLVMFGGRGWRVRDGG